MNEYEIPVEATEVENSLRAENSFPSANTRYSFLHLTGLGRALQSKAGANSGEVSAQ